MHRQRLSPWLVAGAFAALLPSGRASAAAPESAPESESESESEAPVEPEEWIQLQPPVRERSPEPQSPEVSPPPAEPKPSAPRIEETPAQPEPAAPEAEEPEAEDPESGAPESEEFESEEYTREVVVGSMFGDEGVPRLAGSAHSIGERELEAHEHDNIHDVVRTVPGVYVRGEDGFGLRPNIGLRGASPNRSSKVTLMEDGVLFAPAPYAAPAAYYFPLTTRMVGVEVFKGPASIRHGPNTIGGAINLRTRQIPLRPAGFVDLAGGRFGYGKVHSYWGTTYKGFGVLVEGARIQSRGFKELDNGGDTGFGKNDAMLKLGYRSPDERPIAHIVELKGGVANELSHETYLGLTDHDFEATPYRRYAASQLGRMDWWRTQAELTYVMDNRKAVQFEARLYRHDFDRTWRKANGFPGDDPDYLVDDPGFTSVFPNAFGTGEVGLEILQGERNGRIAVGTNRRIFAAQGGFATLRYTPVTRGIVHDIELGGRVHADFARRDESEVAYDMTRGILLESGDDPVTTKLERGSAVATAFHLHDAATFFDRLTVAPGLRLELVSTRLVDRTAMQADPGLEPEESQAFRPVVLPGLGLHFMATKWLGVFGGVHRGMSPVAPGQAEDIGPELAMNYEAGMRVDDSRGFKMEAIGFYSDYSNMLGTCSIGGANCAGGMIGEQFAAGRVLVWGVESLAAYTHRFSQRLHLSAGGTYTYTGSSFREPNDSPPFGDAEVGDELPYVPKHVAGGYAGVGGDRWDLRAKVNYNGNMRDEAGQGAFDELKVPGFATLDVSGEVRVFDGFRIYALVNNATNAQYMISRRPYGARPGAPLTFMIGIKAFITPRPKPDAGE